MKRIDFETYRDKAQNGKRVILDYETETEEYLFLLGDKKDTITYFLAIWREEDIATGEIKSASEFYELEPLELIELLADYNDETIEPNKFTSIINGFIMGE